VRQTLGRYLEDPFLKRLYSEIRAAGSVRSISVDLTHDCNLRCAGCYYFSEGMDRFRASKGDADFDGFLEREKERGTNFITVVGGEPSLELGRLKKIYDGFWMNVATNGLRKIPREGFEQMPIGVSVWGDHATDRELRGGGRTDVFARALRNYRDDPRAFWYYTVSPGKAEEIEPVVRTCIENGNRVLYNFYSDIDGLGGDLDYRRGFSDVRRAIDRTIERYPDQILMTSYFSEIVATGRLFDQRWGHDVCTNATFDHPVNAERVLNGNPFNPHFRAYNSDFATTRRCCTGIDRDCDSCFDVWEHFSWIMLNMRKHLETRASFTNWLTTMYLFYLINRMVDYDGGVALLPEIHRRSAESVAPAISEPA
jgi:hypothetical protein